MIGARKRPVDLLGVLALDGHLQQGRGFLVRRRVGLVGVRQVDVERVELAASSCAAQRPLDQRGLLVDVQPGQHERHLVAIAAQVVQADFDRRRRRLAAHAGDAHAIGPLLLELDRVETGHHVGIDVGRLVDFVQQLGRDRADRDQPAGALVLGDHARTVFVHLGDRKAGMLEAGHLAERTRSCRRCTACRIRRRGPRRRRRPGGPSRCAASQSARRPDRRRPTRR